MKRVERGEILGLEQYEQIRDQFQRRVVAEKRARRVALGGNMTVLFENHDTVLLQIQEMLRTERITAEAAIRHEIDTYNELIAGTDELSATIFIEYPDEVERERMLAALAGVEDRFHFEVDGERLPARGEHQGDRTDRTTAVQYVKFPLSSRAADALRRGTGVVSVGVDHPAYAASAVLEPATRRSLAEDLG